jgi:hypothetical protein
VCPVKRSGWHGISFSETEDAQLEHSIRDRVIPKTQLERMKFGKPAWEAFLRERGWTELSNYSIFLEYLDGSRLEQLAACKLVGLYAVALKKKQKNVKVHLLALQDMFTASGRSLPPGVFDSKYTKEAKKSHSRSEGREAAEEAMKNETHAIPGELLVSAFDKYCPEGFALEEMKTEQVDRVFQAGMSGLVYQYGLRGGNTGRTKSEPQARKEVQLQVVTARRAEEPLTEDQIEELVLKALDGHALRAKDVMLGRRNEQGEAEFESAYTWSKRPAKDMIRASMIELCFKTSKPDNFGKRPSRKMLDMLTSSLSEGKLVVILSKIASYAAYDSEEDLFFSRKSLVTTAKPEERKSYRLKDVSEFAKAIAESKGWETKGFSSKSFKEAVITSFALSGGSDRETATAFGHRSISASRHYRAQVLAGSSGGLAQVDHAEIRGLTELDVERNLQLHHGLVIPKQQSSSRKQNELNATPGSR